MVLPTEHVWDLRGHDGPVTTVKLNKDGRYCMTCGGTDRTVRLWNPQRADGTGEHALHVAHYDGAHNHEISDVAMSVAATAAQGLCIAR